MRFHFGRPVEAIARINEYRDTGSPKAIGAAYRLEEKNGKDILLECITAPGMVRVGTAAVRTHILTFQHDWYLHFSPEVLSDQWLLTL